MSMQITGQVLSFKAMPYDCDHENLRIVLVLQGECEVKRMSSSAHFGVQDAFFINAHTTWCMTSAKGCVVQMVYVPLQLLEKTGRYFGNMEMVDSISNVDQTKDIAFVYRDCAFLKDLIRLYMPSREQDEDLLADKILNALVTDYSCLSYSGDLYRSVNMESMIRYLRAVDYIRKHMTEKLTLQNAADAEGMQKSYFAQVFKQMSGMTFLECVSRIRLMKTEELLLLDDCSNSEIIRRCGFTDSKYFYKYFQQEFSTTPAEWRESHKSFAQDVHILQREEAEHYLQNLYDELLMVNTDTRFYAQYALLKEMEKQGIPKDLKVAVELYHPANILVVDGKAVNTWYGFDLIMDFAGQHELKVYLILKADDIPVYSEDLSSQMEKSIVRYGAQVVHNWNFEIMVNDPAQISSVHELQIRLEKIIPDLQYRITC